MPEEESNFARGSIELLKILMLTGALVGIYSIFQLWFSANSGTMLFDYNGFDLFTKSSAFHGQGHYFVYLPLAVLISSAIAVVASVLSFTKHERMGAVAGIILGAVIVVVVLQYIYHPQSEMWVESSNMPGSAMVTSIPLGDFLGEGIYSALIGGIFLVVGGLIILINRVIGAMSKKEE